jgi:antitoxin MazE
MRISLRKIGGETGVAIPRPLLKKLGLSAGDRIEMTLQGNSIVMTPVGRHPREGWAEDSKALAQSGEGLVWDNPDKDWAW